MELLQLPRREWGRNMVVDPRALQRATQALAEHLHSEAQAQNAYMTMFPDGRVSLELEWISLELMAKTVLLSYLKPSPDVAPSDHD
jgi:hypothetical protein